MSDEKKSTRDIVIEMRGEQRQYFEASRERRVLLEKRFEEFRENHLALEEQMDKNRDAIEKRVHCMEKKVWAFSGAVLLIGAIWQHVWAFLTGGPKH